MRHRVRSALLFIAALMTIPALLVPAAPAHAYAPALTPALVREAQTHYKWIASDFLPYPSEWSQGLPGNAGFVMVVTPFIRLCMGIAADEYIAHYNHTEAEHLNPIIIERLNLFFADTLLLYVELPHPSVEPIPARPYVELVTPAGKTLGPRSMTVERRPRELLRGGKDVGYTTRFHVQFALSDGITPSDTIRVTVRQSGRVLGTLTFDLRTMR